MNERKPPLFGLHIVQAHGQLEPADYGVDFPDFLHSDLVSDSEHRTLYLKNALPEKWNFQWRWNGVGLSTPWLGLVYYEK